MNDLTIRQMKSSDVRAAMRLKEAEGWNQTELDWHLFLKHNPDLCLVACVGGQVVGTVTAINYNNEVAWIGMMLVSRDFRKQGIGNRLLNAVISRLSDCHSIKLDATPAGRLVYQKLGFVEELELHRLSIGELTPFEDQLRFPGLRPMEEGDLSQVCDLDRRAFGGDRCRRIRSVRVNRAEKCWVIEKSGSISGFIMGRDGTRFNHVGPIVAPGFADARVLFLAATKHLAGQPAVMDVPAGRTEWLAWLYDCGFSLQRSLFRMYLKNNLTGEKEALLFSILGPELG